MNNDADADFATFPKRYFDLLGNQIGGTRYLGSCDCGCGRQHLSTHARVHVTEYADRSRRIVDAACAPASA